MEHLEEPRLKKLQRICPPHPNATGGDGPLRRGRGRHWLRAQHISPCAPRRPAGLALHLYLSSLRSSQTAVTLSSTINTDTQLARDMWTTCPRNPSPPGKHTRARLSPASPTSCLSAPSPFCLAAHSHSRSCFCPFCMCAPRPEPAAQEGNLILSFCTCSQIPSLSRAGIVPRLMETES